MTSGSPEGEALDLRAAVKRHRWYHTLELAPGVVTPGMFDHRAALEHYPIPSDLSGARCLDVGTMDGFWAFEMERRGAREVVAIDLDDMEALDWPVAIRDTYDGRKLGETNSERFALAKHALGSAAERMTLSVYDLDASHGAFDFVFCGDLLVHLKDPITACERMRAVCAGSTVVCTPITRVRFRERRPLAEIDGIDEFAWWTLNLAGLTRLLLSAGFGRVESAKPFAVPTLDGGWRGLRGAVRAWT